MTCGQAVGCDWLLHCYKLSIRKTCFLQENFDRSSMGFFSWVKAGSALGLSLGPKNVGEDAVCV